MYKIELHVHVWLLGTEPGANYDNYQIFTQTMGNLRWEIFIKWNSYVSEAE